MIHQHYYRHLDRDSKFEVKVDLLDLAKRLEEMNYGVQRFLSHLVDVRRAKHEARAADYAARGDKEGKRIAERLFAEGDELAEEIHKLLQRGLS